MSTPVSGHIYHEIKCPVRNMVMGIKSAHAAHQSILKSSTSCNAVCLQRTWL